jgi:iron complex transport system ATP-binding protein
LTGAEIAPEGLTMRELVAQGRYPHQSWLQQWRVEDETAVNRALTITGMNGLTERPADALSGGQRQQAWIAMTLVQETELLLDEPTTFLDLAHQLEVLHLLERLNQKEGRTVVMVVHDLNHATRHAHHIITLSEGQIAAAGRPADITPTILPLSSVSRPTSFPTLAQERRCVFPMGCALTVRTPLKLFRF